MSTEKHWRVPKPNINIIAYLKIVTLLWVLTVKNHFFSNINGFRLGCYQILHRCRPNARHLNTYFLKYSVHVESSFRHVGSLS